MATDHTRESFGGSWADEEGFEIGSASHADVSACGAGADNGGVCRVSTGEKPRDPPGLPSV
eukprot:3623689-Rhodomonas_salina.1